MADKTTYNIKVNLPGGVVSAGDLYEILLIAEGANATTISVGNRQQLYFNIAADQLESLETGMLRAEVNYEINGDVFPNIISSYATDNIISTESWLKEEVYKDIFDLFDFQPGLKVNLVDKHQTFVPFFSGNLNFISSNISNYWYLYTRFPKTNNVYCWPALIYSEDIPVISKHIEKVIMRYKQLFYDKQTIDYELFNKKVGAGNSFVTQPITEPLKIPDFSLPYYEGLNQYQNNKYWLGVYRRNELFPLDFLKDICNLCLKTRLGQLYTTPWKSLLVKGINETDRKEWGLILNKYQINVRHAANELNWQLENLCSESLELKKLLVSEFEAHDQRTYRLCFTIKMHPKTGLLASIIIKKRADYGFDILHTSDFNPNSKDLVIYKEKIHRDELSKQLIGLCNEFYRSLTDNTLLSAAKIKATDDIKSAEPTRLVFQCSNCLSIYDETYGDIVNGVKENTPFETLKGYVCPVCEAPKEDFMPLEIGLPTFTLNEKI